MRVFLHLKRGVLVAVTGFLSLFLSLPLIASVGTEVFEFLRLPNGARCAALSGSRMGMMGDPFALFSNPAGLHTDTKAVGMSYTRYVADIQGGCGTYVSPMLGGTLAAGVSYLNYGKMEKMSAPPPQVLGTFTSQSLVPALGYSRTFGSSKAGAAAKIIYQSIDEYTGIAVAGDVGYTFYPEGWPGLAIGGTVQNLGVKVSDFYGASEPLPMLARLGGSYLLFNRLVLISAELELPAKEFVLGIEWKPAKQLAIRGGYYSLGHDSEAKGDLDVLAGKSLGIGLNIREFSLDYALTPMVDIGLVHRISLTRPITAAPDKSKKKPKPEKKLKQTPETEKQTEETIEEKEPEIETKAKKEPEEKKQEQERPEEKPQEEPEEQEAE